MPSDVLVPSVLFVAVVLSAALGALAASGHFPQQHRAPSLRSAFGGLILFGACGLTALSFVVAAVAAWRILPWPVAVIAGGAAILTAPLLLRPLPDYFVNGRAALLVFSCTSVLFAVLLAGL